MDTISKDGFSKTLVNKQAGYRAAKEAMTEEEREDYMKQFVKTHEKDIKAYGWLRKWDDSKAFLLEHTELACEETANYLVIHCLNLAMEEVCGSKCLLGGSM